MRFVGLIESSPQKHALRVRRQRISIRSAGGVSWHPDTLVVRAADALAVVEVILEAAADEEAAVRGDGDVALIVEAMDVGTEEKAVVEAVLAPFADRKDVSGVQDRQGLLSGDRATTLIVIRHQHAEGALAQ